MLPEQLGILTLWRPELLKGGLFFFNGQSWTNILRYILDYIRILAGIRPKTRILTTPGCDRTEWTCGEYRAASPGAEAGTKHIRNIHSCDTSFQPC